MEASKHIYNTQKRRLQCAIVLANIYSKSGEHELNFGKKKKGNPALSISRFASSLSLSLLSVPSVIHHTHSSLFTYSSHEILQYLQMPSTFVLLPSNSCMDLLRSLPHPSTQSASSYASTTYLHLNLSLFSPFRYLHFSQLKINSLVLYLFNIRTTS